MEIGQVVDFIEEYNAIHDDGDRKQTTKKKPKDTKRKATQADWDAFWG